MADVMVLVVCGLFAVQVLTFGFFILRGAIATEGNEVEYGTYDPMAILIARGEKQAQATKGAAATAATVEHRQAA